MVAKETHLLKHIAAALVRERLGERMEHRDVLAKAHDG